MFGKTYVRDLIDRSAENESDRRKFLTSAGVAGLGVVGAGVLTSLPSGMAGAAVAAAAPSDGAVLNFALNLEYLEAEFYSWAVHGHGLASSLTTGKHAHGKVTGGAKVPFRSKRLHQFAEEIASDELEHVKFLRGALGSAKVAMPNIDLKHSFTAAAQAAGLIKKGQSFNPFANENNFILGSFIFEDVGVSAYKGAAPLINNKEYLGAAAGILAVEAYHAGGIRSHAIERGLAAQTNKISVARDSLDGPKDHDQGAWHDGKFNVTPVNRNGIAFTRSAAQTLNVVYLNPKSVTKGGFFPSGVNGEIHQSGAHG